MNIKLNILTAAILAVVSTAATAAPSLQPPQVDGLYNNGPQSPDIASTDLSAAERSAYANYEAIMQIAEARIHATSCSNSAGEFAVNAFSDGKEASKSSNYATVLSSGGTGSFRVEATLNLPLKGFGQQISVDQAATGSLKGKTVDGYHADVAYNNVNNMMDSAMQVSVQSINGKLDKYYGKVIKDFYQGENNGDPTSPDYYNIYDWGLQSLDKLGYPVNKYWQRSKSHRDDGTYGRTVFVKDRLVGATTCRIIIDTEGYNNQDFFSQKGWLKIQTGVTPNAAVPEFNDVPF